MKIVTFLFAALLAVGVSKAQNFDVQYTGASFVHHPAVYVSDSLVRGPMNDLIEDTFAVINNLSGSAIDIQVIRLENNLPSGWFTEMCVDQCYAPNVDVSDPINILKGASQYIYIHFYTFSATQQSGNVKMKVVNANDTTEFSTISFYVNSDSTLTGIAENNNVKNPVKVFPNPFTSTAVVSLKNYRAQHGSLALDFTMYDLLGNLVMRKSGVREEQIVINRNGLHSGIYFYKLMNGNKEEAIGRVSIQ